MDLCKFRASLDYRASSRTAKATFTHTQKRKTFLEKPKKKKVICDTPIYNSGTLETRWANLSDV